MDEIACKQVHEQTDKQTDERTVQTGKLKLSPTSKQINKQIIKQASVYIQTRSD
jgi:hypothetical protein